MKKVFKIIAFVFIFFAFPYFMASGSEIHVANIVSVSGTVYLQTGNSSDWISVSESMAVTLDDKLKTEANSYADIEFLSGGHVAINQNTTIQITGTGDISDVTERSFIQNIIITSGEIWAKITQQQQEIQFQTNGGTVAIKGTEFVIEENAEKEETTVSLLEGQILFRDPENNETLFNAGDKVKILVKKITDVEKYLPDELRSELKRKFNSGFINFLDRSIFNLPINPGVPVNPNPPVRPNLPF